ncbi:Oligopeptide transport ATP-binding protein OppF [Paraburkholderia piptadeniae]|uniref:Oligopeptide transport ATP-binding protein OppF n=1 Tax=Paraburkholderia piptadeniae TaxID=1701573 RepID=A0A1N7SPL3_9BURK|nr:ATP-binding cassette domain-containing protein [Paraburkholderia piptadeniae]SIT49374.1 Oligopeptide transport ATP-binding protein OppF [Paraburkholderia piptadeniae]
MMAPLLRVSNLNKVYGDKRLLFRKPGDAVRAVCDVSFEVGVAETFGLVGESGSGKSTVGRLISLLDTPTSGEIVFEGRSIFELRNRELRAFRRKVQIVFQDPYSSLSPRMRVGDFVAEPFIVHGVTKNRRELEERVARLFKMVGLDPVLMRRYPHEFSGGQRQRICIARAIALEPSFVVADEAITALDVSVQAQIVNLFEDLREQLGFAYTFIAHDLTMVRYLCQRVAVMRQGRIVEMGLTEDVFANPLHPYTRTLLAAIPRPDPALKRARYSTSTRPVPEAAESDRLVEVEANHFVLGSPCDPPMMNVA